MANHHTRVLGFADNFTYIRDICSNPHTWVQVPVSAYPKFLKTKNKTLRSVPDSG